MFSTTATRKMWTTVKTTRKLISLPLPVFEKFKVSHLTSNIVSDRKATSTSWNVPIAAKETALSKDEARSFMAVFPDLVRELTDTGRHLDVPEVTKWYAKVLQYNVSGGKKNRGLTVVMAYKILSKELTEENLRRAQMAGWCVEMLQAFYLVADDIMDNAVTRRNRPCWYRTHNLGVKALNDSMLIEAGLYQVLKNHFKDQPYYIDLVELFHDSTMKTLIGQYLDSNCLDEANNPKLDNFTMSRYNSIAKYKTGYYSFHLPVAIALYMAGIRDPELHRQAKTILLEMGHFFQVQDDFLDCYGDSEVIGKIGTDIEDGKCSWLAVVALQRANPEQRKIMEEFYGRNSPEKVAAVKQLYNELGLPATFSTYEEESYNIILTHIQQLSAGLSHEVFLKLLHKIYRRDC